MKNKIQFLLSVCCISSLLNAQVFFQDGFETGNLSHTQNGAYWYSGTNTAVVSGQGRTGNYALRFRYAGVPSGTDCSAEQRFSLGTQMTNTYISYYVKFPSNYTHRSESPNNNKWIRLWGEDSGYGTEGIKLGASSWAGGISRAGMEIKLGGDGRPNCLGGLGQGSVLSGQSWTLTSSDLNKWLHFEWRFQRDNGTGNGVMQLWVDGVLRLNFQNLNVAGAPCSPGYFKSGYLFGWSNSGFNQQTDIYIDDVTFSTQYTGGTSCGGPNPWTNTSFTQQTGVFTADFDVTPSGNNMDGVVGLSNSAAGIYTDLACIVRFNANGNIDARNGASYQAVNTVLYIAGTSYHVKMNINLNTKKYDVYVTPQGGSQQTIASQYDFRTEQNTVSQLNNWAKNTASCSLDVKNFISSITTSVKYSLNNTPFTIYPNPASEQLTIEIPSSEAQAIHILDLLGRELIKENITGTLTTLSITGLKDGIYMCIIMDKNGNKLGAEKVSIINR